MDVLVYARTEHLDEAVERFAADLGHRDTIAPRNATAYTAGQVEPVDRVHVDDTFPQIADEYRARDDVFTGTVETFDANELAVPEPPQPSGPSTTLDPEDFASPTARDAAVEAGLGASDFEGVEPRGKTGYTTAQVREMVS